MSQQYSHYALFLVRTSKFWPSLVVLRFWHKLSLNCSLNCSCSAKVTYCHIYTGAAERSKKWGAEAGERNEWGGVGVFDKEYPSSL